MMEPRRILIVRRKAIGDVVVSMDVARALRERWPEASIHLVVDRFVVDVVEGSPWIDALICYDRALQSRGPWLARARAFVGWIRRLREVRADLVLDLMGTPQTAMWTRLSGAPVRVGPRKRWRTWAYDLPVEPEVGHHFAGERFLEWARRLEIDPGSWRPQPTPVSASDRERVRAALELRGAADRPLVLLNASATWSAKAWPWASFAAAAEGIRERAGAEVALAWAPGEEEAVEAIVHASGGAVWPLPPTSLRELSAWLEASSLLITTDSGPKHIAVSHGTPTVTVFGSTDPRGWQPPGDVHRGLTNPVDCHPCNRLECNVPGHPCLDELAPELVIAAACDLLDRDRTRV